MSPAPLRSLAVIVALGAMLAACGRSPVDVPDRGPTVDPWIYAYGLCSFKCYRLDQCGLAMQSEEACLNACIDDALATFEGDACWAEQIEVRRCVVLEAECDGVEDEELPLGAEMACTQKERELRECGS